MSLPSGEVRTPGEAWRIFRRRRAPRWLIGALALLLVARLGLGEPSWRDAAAAGALALIYPFGEWAIHVYLLHLPPVRWRGREVELLTTREHRVHHESPNDLNLVLLGAKEVIALLVIAVPLVASVLVVLLPGPFDGRAWLSAITTGAALVLMYEWIHFLIHTAHRPHTRLYRAVWRSHRLHHFKNEHYWHGITSTVADRVLGTAPDHRTVERSPTARSLRR